MKVQVPKKFNQEKSMYGLGGRTSTIFKKTKELSVLCDIEALLLLYDPGSNTPHIYCSKKDPKTIINKYLYLHHHGMKSKGKKQLSGLARKKQLDVCKLGIEELTRLVRILAGKIGLVDQMINLMKEGSRCNSGSSTENERIDMLIGSQSECDHGHGDVLSSDEVGSDLTDDVCVGPQSGEVHCDDGMDFDDLDFWGFDELQKGTPYDCGTSNNDGGKIVFDYSDGFDLDELMGEGGSDQTSAEDQDVSGDTSQVSVEYDYLEGLALDDISVLESTDQSQMMGSKCSTENLLPDGMNFDDLKFHYDNGADFLQQQWLTQSAGEIPCY